MSKAGVLTLVEDAIFELIKQNLSQKCVGTTQNYLYPIEKLQPIQIFNLIYALIFIIFNKIKAVQGSLLENLSKFYINPTYHYPPLIS